MADYISAYLGEQVDGAIGLVASPVSSMLASSKIWSVGSRIGAGGYTYIVAPTAATDHHLTTAGGVKLYAQPVADNYFTPEQLGYTDALKNLGAVAQIAWNAGRVMHLGPKVYITSSTAFVRSFTGFIGEGDRVSGIRVADGVACNVVDTENFAARQAGNDPTAESPSVPLGVLIGVTLKNFYIDGGRGSDVGAGNVPVGTAVLGIGIRLYARMFLIQNVRVVCCAAHGMQTCGGAGTPNPFVALNDARAGYINNLTIMNCGWEGFIFQGPPDIPIVGFWIGNNGRAKTGSYDPINPFTSLVFAGYVSGATVDGLVLDNFGAEFSKGHCWNHQLGRGIRMRTETSGIRARFFDVISEGNWGQVQIEPGARVEYIGEIHSNNGGPWLNEIFYDAVPTAGTAWAIGNVITDSVSGAQGTITAILIKSPTSGKITVSYADEAAREVGFRDNSTLSVAGNARRATVHQPDYYGAVPWWRDDSMQGNVVTLKALQTGGNDGAPVLRIGGQNHVYTLQHQAINPASGNGVEIFGDNISVRGYIEGRIRTLLRGNGPSTGLVIRSGAKNLHVDLIINDCQQNVKFEDTSVGSFFDISSSDPLTAHSHFNGASSITSPTLDAATIKRSRLVSLEADAVVWEALHGTGGSSGSGTVTFPTVAALVASPSPSLGSVGDLIFASSFRYNIAAAGASDHHLVTAGGVKLYVNADGLDTIVFDSFNPAKNGDSSEFSGGTADADVIDDIPKLHQAIALAAGRRIALSAGDYGQATTLVLPSNAWIDGGGLYGARLCATNALTGWQVETANFDAAKANADGGDANADFNALVPRNIAFTGIKIDGRFESYFRSFYVKPRSSCHGMRIYARDWNAEIQVLNVPGKGLWSFGKGGNGPTPLQAGYSRRVTSRLYIHMTGEEGMIWDGPGDQQMPDVYQVDAGARLAATEADGKLSSPTYGGTNGGFTDGCVFVKGAEIKFMHAWGNRAGRGVVQYGGRILSDIMICESNAFGGLRLEDGTGMFSLVKLHKTTGWRTSTAAGSFSNDPAFYHSSGLSNENDSHTINEIKYEDNSTSGVDRAGSCPAIQIGSNSRWLHIGHADISKRGICVGNGLQIDAGASSFSLGGAKIRHCAGEITPGVRSAAVQIDSSGRNYLSNIFVEDCDVALRTSGTAPVDSYIQMRYRLDPLTADGATACVVQSGTPRSNPGQRWDITGFLSTAYSDIANGPGPTLTVLTADSAGATLVPTHRRHLLACQAAGTYTVANITAAGYMTPGYQLSLATISSAGKITFATTGNIRCNSGTGRTLLVPSDRILLEYDGANWVELAFAKNV